MAVAWLCDDRYEIGWITCTKYGNTKCKGLFVNQWPSWLALFTRCHQNAIAKTWYSHIRKCVCYVKVGLGSYRSFGRIVATVLPECVRKISLPLFLKK